MLDIGSYLSIFCFPVRFEGAEIHEPVFANYGIMNVYDDVCEHSYLLSITWPTTNLILEEIGQLRGLQPLSIAQPHPAVNS